MAFDYSDFKAYRKNVGLTSTQFNNWLSRFINNLAQASLERVKALTPVGTGYLRSCWEVEIHRRGGVLYIEFDNLVDYAWYVEYGHATPYMSGIGYPGGPYWVRGHFMMTITLEELQRHLPAIFENEFNRFLSRMGMR